MRYYLPLLCLLALLPAQLSAGPLFDAHLHYNAQDAEQLSPQQVINTLKRNDIKQAVVTSTPASLTQTLYQAAPDRIVPLLGVYRSHADKIRWVNDPLLPARLKKALKSGHWHGIGELHIFAWDRHSPVFQQLIKLAQQHRLVLQIHADPAVIDTVYEIAADQPVAWAHAGAYPYPDLLADYLKRYPNLMIDLSVRDERIAPNGVISDDWYELFVRFPGRFMIGVDTYSTSRWHDFDNVVSSIRHWLAQLPGDVAQRLSYDNAAAFFVRP